MSKSYINVVNILDNTSKMIDWIGKRVSILNLILVFLICIDVFLRYLFSFSKNWILELEWHLFAIIFLMGAAYGLKHDKHVRVDVFYQKASDKNKAWINLIGTVLFLLPWCYVIIKTSTDFALNSWSMNEGSPNPGGLPARYFIKSIIPLAFVLLFIEGLYWIKKNINILRST